MAAQIHSNFRRLHEKLQNEVIRAGLNVAKVVNDFKLPEPKESEVGKQLNNMAICESNRHYFNNEADQDYSSHRDVRGGKHASRWCSWRRYFRLVRRRNHGTEFLLHVLSF